MKQAILLCGLSLVGAILGVGCTRSVQADDDKLKRFEASEIHMGVDFTIVLYAPNSQAANEAFRAAFARIAQLNGVMSDYDAQSELSRLSAAAPTTQEVKLSQDLYDVLAAAQAWSAKTEGAFDVTVGPLVRLWRRARRQREMPSQERLEEARRATGYRYLKLDPERHAAQLTQPDMRLDLGGIAKGFAVDEALEVLRRRGVRRALVNGSGDIGASGPPPGEQGWKVGIAPLEPGGEPSRILLLADGAVATSGDAFQFVEIDGRRYSHIVDPHTGLGLTDHSSVTIVAPNCTIADALASSVSVLGPKKGLALVESIEDAAALIVRAPHGNVEVHRSRRFEKLPSSDANRED